MRTCTERECYFALRNTSAKIRVFNVAYRRKLIQYAGPQCYPQLYIRERLQANAENIRSTNGKGDAPAQPTEDTNAQLMPCWMACDGCGARRLVDQSCMPALTTEAFQRSGGALEVGDVTFWRDWLKASQSRYDDIKRKVEAHAPVNLSDHILGTDSEGVVEESAGESHGMDTDGSEGEGAGDSTRGGKRSFLRMYSLCLGLVSSGKPTVGICVTMRRLCSGACIARVAVIDQQRSGTLGRYLSVVC